MLESARLERLEHDLAELQVGDVIHVHWTAPVVQRASSPSEARARLVRFKQAIEAARGRGARLVWTVHNALAHDARHEDLEIELSRFLAGTADVVHVLNSKTDEVVSPLYDLSKRTIAHIPHPSYRGVYDGAGSRDEARASFELEEDDLAVLFFGQVRPYKGVDMLIDALGKATPPGRIVLMLAGKTSSEDVRVVDALLPEGLRTIRQHDFVHDGDVKRWFDAADVAVLPYRRILNSGSLHLAATFGVPTVLPDEPHLRGDFGAERWIRWFRPGDAGSLAEILSQPLPPRGTARDFADRLSPFSISRRYDDLLRNLVA